MEPFLLILLSNILLLPIVLWLLVIRPYCIRNGKGYTPGATWATTLWVDWQQAREIARAKGHRWMRVVCGLVFWLLLLLTLGMLLSVMSLFLW